MKFMIDAIWLSQGNVQYDHDPGPLYKNRIGSLALIFSGLKKARKVLFVSSLRKERLIAG